MERALLERMVGAVVLVLLLVLVAPALLDGRDDQGADLFADTAASDRDGETRIEVVVLNAPVSPPPLPDPVETVVAVAPAAGSAEPAQRDAGAAAPQPGKQPPQGFAVQVNAFSDERNAQRYATEIKNAGFAVFVIRGQSTGGALYRVYSGPEESREAAGALASRLQGKGYKGIVVQLDSKNRG